MKIIKVIAIVSIMILLFLMFRENFYSKKDNLNILLCGFEPFGSYDYNSSWEAIKSYSENKQIRENLKILQLPVSYNRAPKILQQEIDGFTPDIVIIFGMGSLKIIKEPVVLHPIALNFDDSYFPDNDNIVRLEKVIREDGPAAFWSKLPFAEIKKELLSNGISCRYFHFAGNYLSNHMFYELMYLASKNNNIKAAGLIHIAPYSDNFTHQDSVNVVEITLKSCIENINRSKFFPLK